MNTRQGSERREFGRRPSRTDAYVVVDGRPAVSCVLLNISDTGAFLQVSDSFSPPAVFHLVLPNNRIDVSCQVRHRTQEGIGVKFIGGSIAALLAFTGSTTPATAAPLAPPRDAPPERPRTSGVELRASLIKGGETGAATDARRFTTTPGRVIRGQ